MGDQLFGGHLLDPEAREVGDLRVLHGRALDVAREDHERPGSEFDLPVHSLAEKGPGESDEVVAVRGGVGFLLDQAQKVLDRQFFQIHILQTQRRFRVGLRRLCALFGQDLLLRLHHLREALVIHAVHPDPRHFRPDHYLLEAALVLDLLEVAVEDAEECDHLVGLQVGQEDDLACASEIELPVQVRDRLARNRERCFPV